MSIIQKYKVHFIPFPFLLPSFFLTVKILASLIHSLSENPFSPGVCIVAELPTGAPESNRFTSHNTVFSVYVLLKNLAISL